IADSVRDTLLAKDPVRPLGRGLRRCADAAGRAAQGRCKREWDSSGSGLESQLPTRTHRRQRSRVRLGVTRGGSGLANLAVPKAGWGMGRSVSPVVTNAPVGAISLAASLRAASKMKITHQYSSKYACERKAPAVA